MQLLTITGIGRADGPGFIYYGLAPDRVRVLIVASADVAPREVDSLTFGVLVGHAPDRRPVYLTL